MQRFQTEIKNPVIAQDILDLEKKIRLYRSGNLEDEKFRSLRLVRGIYGQRQPGVQMVRIKLPIGKLTTRQLRKIADIAEEYSYGNLHATTRQDIQIHYVSLDRTPEMWARLEEDEVTIREACGNTVRNITASPTAGIDPDEPFDVSPYAWDMFRYFLRNPICQDMGRKFKIAFSSSDKDTAYTFIHDIGFIPKIKIEDGREKRGFKVVIGGGLGSIPYHAQTAFEFLEDDKIIPFTEGLLRVFDRYGERLRRQKARFKFLLADIGMEELMRRIDEEWESLKSKTLQVDLGLVPEAAPPEKKDYPKVEIKDRKKYDDWYRTNVFEQKQKGFFGVFVKLPLGNLDHQKSRLFADVVDKFAADDVRVTVNQGYLLRFVRPEALENLFVALDEIGLAEPGFDSVADIAACPGTDSCNLAISNSTNIAVVLEEVVRKEYYDLIYNNELKIKISGCPNSCGQHGMASIGFHGSSQKNGTLVFPALQVVLGGGVGGNGTGYLAEKVIKVPSRRGPDTLRMLLDDYAENKLEGEYYYAYFQRQSKNYFYQLLKPLTDMTTLEPGDYVDWGSDQNFEVKTEAGECAGVVIDLVSTLLNETEEKIDWAKGALEQGSFADSIYHAYTAFIQGAKALLLDKDVRVNTQIGVMNDFQKHYVDSGNFEFEGGFKAHLLRMKDHEPSKEFAENYLADAMGFLKAINEHRVKEVVTDNL
jgi:sulfite reductase (ferredoxin)